MNTNLCQGKMEYKLMTADTAAASFLGGYDPVGQFNERVNELLANGFCLYGGTKVSGTLIVQALVKYS